MPKQKLVFIVPYLWHGGVEKVVHETVQNLNTKHFEIHLAFFHSQTNMPVCFKPEIQIHDISLPETSSGESSGLPNAITPWGNLATYTPALIRNFIIRNNTLKIAIKSILRAVKGQLRDYEQEKLKEDINPLVNKLKDFIKKFTADTIFIPVMETATIAFWLAQETQPRHYLSWQHAYESWAIKYQYSDDLQKRLAKKGLLIKACQASDCVIVPSDACKQDWIKNFSLPIKQIQTISNPVNLSWISSQSSKETIDIPQNRTLFVHVSRLYQEKNHKFLIRACELLQKKLDNFVVFCIGSGPLQNEINKEIRSKNLEKHIVLLGEKSNPYPYIANARALLLTSVSESFGLVLVEAMACGTPVISVDCPVGPKEILGNGQFGLLIPMTSPRKFSNTMQRIATNEDVYTYFKHVGLARAKDYELNQAISRWNKILNLTSLKL